MVAIVPFQNNLDLNKVFSYSANATFIYKKTEKLVVAVSLVAGLVKDNHALSGALVSKTLELLSIVSSCLLPSSVTSIDVRRNAALRSLALIAEISTLCDVGHYSKQMTEMNATLLKREFALLYKTISEEIVGQSDREMYFTKDFFAEAAPEIHKGHDKGQSVSFTKQPYIKQESTVFQGSQKTTTSKAPSIGASSEGRSDRRVLILKTIREKGEVGVNEVADGVKGVGGKTIQRELLAMVAEGVLKKQGERRWSRYSII